MRSAASPGTAPAKQPGAFRGFTMPRGPDLLSAFVTNAQSAAALVELRALSKRYGKGSLVLEEVSLEVSPGELVALIGPSGCGKSTLLKLLAGLLEPSAGSLAISGRAPHESRGKLAYIFQEATLLPWLTVKKNIELPLRLRGVPQRERARAAEDLLDTVGLDKVRTYYPRQLSGGMRMRVSLARGLSLKPEILLLDEPFGALDAMTRNELNVELLRLRAAHPFTGFFVTHSVSEAVFLAQRVVILSANPGRIAHVHQVSLPDERNEELRESLQYQREVAEVMHRLHQVER